MKPGREKSYVPGFTKNKNFLSCQVTRLLNQGILTNMVYLNISKIFDKVFHGVHG